MASLQEQYNLIKEGKSTAKDVFLKHAKALFPQYIPNHFDFELTTKILKTKSIITEGYVDLTPSHQIQSTPKQSFELAFEKFLQEAKKKEAEEIKIKADNKKTDKSVEDIQDNDYDQKNTKSIDNVIFDQLQRGVYTEMSKDPDQDLKKVKEKVLKNLTKDPIYYTKNSAFGLEIPGYTDQLPGAIPSKTDKMEPVNKEKVKSNVKDSLTKTESAKKGKPKEVKSEMTQTSKTSKGVKKMDMPGKEKIIKLKEGMGLVDLLEDEDYKHDVWYNDAEHKYIELLDTWGKSKADQLFPIHLKRLDPNLTIEDFFKIYNNKNINEGPLEDADAKLAKDQAAKEAEAASIEKQRADNKLKIATANKNV